MTDNTAPLELHIVTGSYMTESGNFGSFRYELFAKDGAEAFDLARERLTRDRRRRYFGKLDMSCSVWTPPPVLPAHITNHQPKENDMTEVTLHTAACLWEAALEALAKGEEEARAEGKDPRRFWSFERRLHAYRLNNGTCTLRQEVVNLSARCDAAWDALSEDDRDTQCFDWDFVPIWLRDNFFDLRGR